VTPTKTSGASSDSSGSRRLRWPFIGIVLVLVVLIILTPNLFATGQAGLQTRAQLIVERPTPGGNTSYYVESIGTSTLYQSIAIGVAKLPSWPYIGTVTQLRNWTWTNGSDTLVWTATSSVNPVAVNVTVIYASSTGLRTEYVGVYGFDDTNSTTPTLLAIGLLSIETSPPSSTPLSELPMFLTLAIEPAKGATT
jgi:hypothetical protein